MTHTVEDIFPKIQAIVADVLVIDEEDVTLEKRLIEDLGAESIDFLDLVFQLEKEFSIKIPRGQLEEDSRGGLTAEEFENNGVVTDRGLEALKNTLSEVPSEFFKTGLKINEIPMLFTVETFCKTVCRALDSKDNQAA